MPVHHALAIVGKLAFGCLIVLALAGVAIMGANLGVRMSAGSLRSAAPAAVLPATPADLPSETTPAATPAEVLAARFPSRFPSEDAVTQPPAFSTATVVPAGQGETFDLGAVASRPTAEPPSWPAADGNAPAGGIPPASAPVEPAKPVAAPHRASARSATVVNDGMIASIKRRLKLSAEQERLWPPVEAALRKIVYTRAALNAPRGATANIDPASPEVEELKSAALPLIIRLNGEQKREVRELAHVMGLESVASQF
jgi:hypothetical protein